MTCMFQEHFVQHVVLLSSESSFVSVWSKTHELYTVNVIYGLEDTTLTKRNTQDSKLSFLDKRK